jgi:hypothetical protein
MLKTLFLIKRLLPGGKQKFFPALPAHQHLVLKFHLRDLLRGPSVEELAEPRRRREGTIHLLRRKTKTVTTLSRVEEGSERRVLS